MALPGVDPYIEGKRSDLLKAIAQAGSQGEAAYKDAQAQTQQYRQRVIDNAAQGFSGSADLTAQLQAQSGAPFDRRLADQASAQADNTAALQRMSAANDSYLTNVSAAQGALQAQNANKLSDREYQLKAIQAELDAKAKQDAEDRAFKMQLELLKAQQSSEAHAAKMAATKEKAAKAAAPKPLTKAQLLGAGQTLSDQYAGFLGQTPASKGTFSADESARALAAYKGIDPMEVNTLLGPREAPKSAPVQLPTRLDRNWIKSNTTFSDKRAGEILAAPEVGLADTMVGTLAGTRFTNGRIDDSSVPQEYRGMTARQAFETWLDTLPGIRSMKDSLRQYYGPWLDANLGR